MLDAIWATSSLLCTAKMEAFLPGIADRPTAVGCFEIS